MPERTVAQTLKQALTSIDTTFKARRRPLAAHAFLLIGLVISNTVLAVAAPRQLDFLRAFQDFLWAMSGVLALLGLTAATVCGLLATDRIVLDVRRRVLLQAVHRSVAVAAVGFLFAHVALQVAFGRVAAHQAVLPFGADAAVAFGAFSTDLLLVIVVTGLLRRRFAGGGRPRLWRAVHAAAYLCWPLAIVHGLTAGREPAGWVVAGYALCLAAVGLALAARLLVAAGPERGRADAERRVTVVRSGGRDAGSDGVFPPPGDRTAQARPAAPRDGDGLAEDLEFWAAIREGRR
ncbi:hypothetical protein [Nocardiopsis suaedae]|uniref:Ferric oxidoreductase domain-containing protein n=1 Tax=Nocardiopsis suaedae TaxID=3018444 RepID=A0ABT4TKV5_9ACTN|nr:hypothetical protein [Nocardiopsis suaedae]MDA2805231.1 hypothetical protein [Nocardiopsis suaedae]